MTLVERFFTGSDPSGASMGNARWMRAGEAWLSCRGSYEEGGIDIGRSYRRDTRWSFDLRRADGLSMGLLGATGDGKGRSILVRTAAKYQGSLCSIDVMGEQALTTAQVRARDQDVLVLDPLGVCAAWRGGAPLGLEGGLNPLDTIDRMDPLAVDRIRALTEMLVEDDEKDEYWPPIVRRFVAGVYAIMVKVGDGTLAGPLDVFDWDAEKRAKWLQTAADVKGSDAMARMIRDGARAYTTKSEKGKGIIEDMVRQNLGVFDSEPMRRVIESGPIRFRDLKRRKASIYIVLPTDKVQSHGVWLRILVDTALAEFAGEKSVPKIPALLMLDEFANIGKLERVKAAVTYARGDGYKIFWAIQDLAQLEDLYGEAWRTIFSQTGMFILLGVEDQRTLEEISSAIGDTERRPKAYWLKLLFNIIWKDAHFKLESSTVPLFRPEEVREFTSLNRGNMLVRIRGRRWLRAKRVNYDEVLEAGVDYIVHPRFSGGSIEPAVPAVEAPEEVKRLEAA